MANTTTTPEQVEDVVAETLAQIGADRDAVTRDATWEQLDVDSLDLAELSQVVEERFGVTIKGDDAKTMKTVGDAVDFVVARAT
jgi:acyl carrier protein